MWKRAHRKSQTYPNFERIWNRYHLVLTWAFIQPFTKVGEAIRYFRVGLSTSNTSCMANIGHLSANNTAYEAEF